MSQNQQILKHLKSGKTLTPLQALGLFDCMRLAARIEEIRDMGYAIHTIPVIHGNKRYAQYKLVR